LSQFSLATLFWVAFHGVCAGYSDFMRPLVSAALLLLALPAPAALHLPMEVLEPLPASWRGVMLDLQALRLAGNSASGESGLRPAYLRALARFEKAVSSSADDEANRGGLLLRLGRPDQALAILRGANARYPDHPRVMAHLATAMSALNDHAGAEAVLLAARRSVPAGWRIVESAHLAFASHRKTGAPFPITDAVALQELMLSFPADGRLMADASAVALTGGDQQAAVRLLEIATGELGVRDPAALRKRAELLSGRHPAHRDPAKPRSYRPLAPLTADVDLPPAENGVQPLPWTVPGASRPGARGYQFPEALKGLRGKRVRMVGYGQFLGDEPGEAPFLLVEQPFGCWWCERPDLSGQVLVDLAEGEVLVPTRRQLTLEGLLDLNATDPERHPIQIRDAKILPDS
jgi:tetratricopeptide (TPR) repeat protein